MKNSLNKIGWQWWRRFVADQRNAPRQQGRPTKVRRQRRVLALRRELRPGDLGFVGA